MATLGIICDGPACASLLALHSPNLDFLLARAISLDSKLAARSLLLRLLILGNEEVDHGGLND